MATRNQKKVQDQKDINRNHGKSKLDKSVKNNIIKAMENLKP